MAQNKATPDRNSRRNTQVMLVCTAVVAGMIGLSFAAVPLYRIFCQVTGYGGTTQVAADIQDHPVLERTLTVRFDANTDDRLQWQFKPLQPSQKLKIGETGLAFYEAYNPTDRPIVGTATYNVAPAIAGYYFTKIDCFCFTEQVLQPGERVEMPVTYYIDPEIVEDVESKGVNTVTLSYTFYEKVDTAAVDRPRGIE